MNSRLRLTSNDINLIILDKFMFENLDKIQQISTLFLLFLFKIALEFKDYCTIQGKTPADLDYRTILSYKSNFNNDSKIYLEDEIGTI